ncbi:hypothetical protein D3C72_1221110 [compost metagenome]
MAEDGRAQRPRHERHAIAGKRQQRRGQRIALREEQLGEDQRGGRSVDEVVVELERGASQAGPGDARDGLLLGRRAFCRGVDADCLHGGSSNGPGLPLACRWVPTSRQGVVSGRGMRVPRLCSVH